MTFYGIMAIILRYFSAFGIAIVVNYVKVVD